MGHERGIYRFFSRYFFLEIHGGVILLLRTTERGVLEDMGNTSVVIGVGLESDGKYIVGIVSGNVNVVGAGSVVLKLDSCKLKLGNLLCALDGETVKFVAGLGEFLEVGQSSESALRRLEKTSASSESLSAKG
jgi:hypothetical protein